MHHVRSQTRSSFACKRTDSETCFDTHGQCSKSSCRYRLAAECSHASSMSTEADKPLSHPKHPLHPWQLHNLAKARRRAAALQALEPKPQTPNPKPQTLNPKNPEACNPNSPLNPETQARLTTIRRTRRLQETWKTETCHKMPIATSGVPKPGVPYWGPY